MAETTTSQSVGKITGFFAGISGPTIILGVMVFLLHSCLTSQGAADRLRDLLVAVVNERLIAQLEIGSVNQLSLTEYELEGVTLTYPDGTDDGVNIIAIHRAEIALAEFPTPGEPIRFESIRLFRPQIRLIESDPGLLGLSPILKPSDKPSSESNDRATGTLSDIVEFHEIAVRGGSVRYVASESPDQPMVLDDIFFETVLEASPDEPGWHTLDLALGRQPGVSVDVTCRLNLDTWLAQIARLDLTASIDPGTIETLPPRLQATLAKLKASGEFHLTAIGELPLTEASNADLRIRTELTDARLLIGDTLLPIEFAQANGQIAEGGFQTESVIVQTLGGRLWGTLSLQPLLPGRPISAVVRAKEIDLSQLVGSESSLAGLLSARGSIDFATEPLQNNHDQIGNLSISVEQGRLMSLPVLSQIARAVDAIPAVGSPANHHAEADIGLLRDRVTVPRMRFVTNAIAGDIRGDIGYDGQIELEAKVGPLQKARELLGPLSLPFDAIVELSRPYRVMGPIADPRVELLGAQIRSGQDGSDQGPG